MEEAHTLAERMLGARPCAPGTRAQRRMPCASSARLRLGAILWRARRPQHHYRQALVLADELGMRPLVAHCHRRPRHAVCRDRPAGAGPYCAVYRHRDVSRHGDDVLAPAGGGGAGTSGGVVKARMMSLEEKGCVSWDISAGPSRHGKENYGNEPEQQCPGKGPPVVPEQRSGST